MAKPQQPAPKCFEEAQKELEQIVADIERGQVSLEESLAKYERGVLLLQYCRNVLAQAEQQIELLSKAENGSLKSAPMPQQPGVDS